MRLTNGDDKRNPTASTRPGGADAVVESERRYRRIIGRQHVWRLEAALSESQTDPQLDSDGRGG